MSAPPTRWASRVSSEGKKRGSPRRPTTVLAAAKKASALGFRVLLNPSPDAKVGLDPLGLTDVLVVLQHELVELVLTRESVRTGTGSGGR